MAAIIRCVGLTKTYQNGVTALNDLNLTIEEGMSFGLMGENGAGKSTLVRLLMGFIFPTKGSLNVLGESDARRAHASIGYLHERPYVELRFTGRRYLAYRAELSDLWGSARTYTVLARLPTRASYCRGLILATALLRIPLFLFMCALALLLRRLTNPTLGNMLIGAPGLLIINILVAALTVALTSPVGTRRKRMPFLAWVALAYD